MAASVSREGNLRTSREPAPKATSHLLAGVPLGRTPRFRAARPAPAIAGAAVSGGVQRMYPGGIIPNARRILP